MERSGILRYLNKTLYTHVSENCLMNYGLVYANKFDVIEKNGELNEGGRN